jgi:Holliday junction resolvase-like predicted endonuclease
VRWPAISTEVAAALGAALLLFALVQSLRLAGARWAVRARLRRARERGAEGEERAEALLLRRGYAILGRQVARSYGIGIDGRVMEVDLRADFLVAHEGRRFVAEVKTGRLAPRLDTPATRRQLLEYRVAFDVSGVLLVDAESERVHAVEFPLPSRTRARASRVPWIALGVLVGVALTAAAQAWMAFAGR